MFAERTSVGKLEALHVLPGEPTAPCEFASNANGVSGVGNGYYQIVTASAEGDITLRDAGTEQNAVVVSKVHELNALADCVMAGTASEHISIAAVQALKQIITRATVENVIGVKA